ncbi:MAG TPA: tripartite tricarboxylate transporter substrate binding protein [Ramlibacter sp.]|jgi:tripartite-type tricarboxylate transporter receptor subunit TctC|nr:tripartite tricarboxylate transporter substrate binding protein [Ramlibacter sp.]
MLPSFKLLATLALASFALSPLAADKYPDPARTIRVVVQFPPGGTSDVVARAMVPRLSKELGTTLIVENRAGAAGNIGAESVAKAKPDGYTILLANNVVVTNPAAGKVPYDVIADFAPIAMVGSIPIALAVHRSVPVNSVAELIDFIKKNPGKHAFSSCGSGTAQHLAGELLKRQAGLDIVHAPYRGCAPAVADGISGQVPILFNAISNVQAHAKEGGALKILAVASAERSSADKSIQTIAEAGIRNFDAQVWFGFMAPAQTPPEVLVKWERAIAAAMRDPEVRKQLAAISFDAKFTGSKQFAGVIASDLVKWSRLITEAQIKVTN